VYPGQFLTSGRHFFTVERDFFCVFFLCIFCEPKSPPSYVLVAHVTRRGATRRSERRIPFASVFAGDGTACVARAEAAVAAAVAAAGGEA
jgi:hypothetical protein